MANVDLDSAIQVFVQGSESVERRWVNQPGVRLCNPHDRPLGWYLEFRDDELVYEHPSQPTFRLIPEKVLKRGGDKKRSPIGRACGVRTNLTILDALAGWGTDALTLSLFGCDVTAVEINPCVRLMFCDLAERLQCSVTSICADSTELMRSTNDKFDVVYVDNMFPKRRKAALPSRSMQLLAELTSGCDLRSSFNAALRVATERIVVKLRKDQTTSLPRAHWSIKAKSVRYDIYSMVSFRQ